MISSKKNTGNKAGGVFQRYIFSFFSIIDCYGYGHRELLYDKDISQKFNSSKRLGFVVICMKPLEANEFLRKFNNRLAKKRN